MLCFHMLVQYLWVHRGHGQPSQSHKNSDLREKKTVKKVNECAYFMGWREVCMSSLQVFTNCSGMLSCSYLQPVPLFFFLASSYIRSHHCHESLCVYAKGLLPLKMSLGFR